MATDPEKARCLHCNKLFVRKTYQKAYCSIRCRELYRLAKQKEERRKGKATVTISRQQSRWHKLLSELKPSPVAEAWGDADNIRFYLEKTLAKKGSKNGSVRSKFNTAGCGSHHDLRGN